MCGEHNSANSVKLRFLGSSPRVRGTRRYIARRRRLLRFIPACAGNTALPAIAKWPLPVHPRVCGEHRHSIKVELMPTGSSPRVRGTPFAGYTMPYMSRFIPACAGNTFPLRVPELFLSVHPRVCGEHKRFRQTGIIRGGSSPRVRGTLHPVQRPRILCRFIPACAGNTNRRAYAWLRRTVHPRVCGEHPSIQGGQQSVSGSSPRVRGTPVPTEPLEVIQRFIPACAGNTRSIWLEL